MTKFFFTLFISTFGFIPAQANIEANKKVVKAFYKMAFKDHKPAEAMKLYVGEKYIQHNPNVGAGKKPFIDYFSNFFPKNPEASSEIKRVIAEGDLVVLHVHSKLTKDDTGRAVVDIFRVENGKIVEHWDVSQEIPATSANKNSMF